MLAIKYLAVLLHIISAAGWFGLGLRLGGLARSATAGGAGGPALAAETERTAGLMRVFALLTLVFAYTALFTGISAGTSYGVPYHIASTLILVLALVQFFLIGPGAARLRKGVDAGDLALAESARKRTAMGVGIGHLLWTVMLVLMFWDTLRAAFAA